MIEVGEYVRTNGGHIRKVTKIIPHYENDLLMSDSSLVELDKKGDISTYKSWQLEEFTIKHSKNLIDLIEPGDYINGYLVLEVCPERGWIEVDCNKQSEECTIWESEIQNIVTHEQFEQIKYKVKEN